VPKDMKIYVPDMQRPCLSAVDIEELKLRADGIILDVDNVTSAFGRDYIPPENMTWFQRLRETNLRRCLATMNPRPTHIKGILTQIGEMDVVFGKLLKPLLAIDYAIGKIGLDPSQIIVVNDLYVVLAYAKTLGCQTIKVEPFLTNEDRGFRHHVTRLIHFYESRFILPRILLIQAQQSLKPNIPVS